MIVGAAAAYIVLLAVRRRRHHRSVRARSRRRARTGSSPRAACSSSGFCGSAVVQWGVYWVLFGTLHPWLFDDLYPRLTHDDDRRTHRVLRSGWRSTSCSACWSRRCNAALRLREGARGRRGSAQHARRDRGGVGVHPPATPARRSLLFLLELRRCSSPCWRSTRWSRPAPAAPGCRCGSASRSGSSTCWRGCG